jgi:hypothetical protein
MAIAFVNIFKQDKKMAVEQLLFILHVSAKCQQHIILKK